MKIAVFDLGGGTFVFPSSSGDGVFEVNRPMAIHNLAETISTMLLSTGYDEFKKTKVLICVKTRRRCNA